MKAARPHKRYHCTLNGCDRVFDELKFYTQHQRDYHLKPFVCALCGKGHSLKKDLKIHERIHRRERPEKCTLCALTFVDPAALRKHTKYVHGNKAVHRPFVCRVCRKCFARKESLQKHHRIHSIPSEQREMRPSKSKTIKSDGMYHCKTCGQIFSSGNALGGHRKAHRRPDTDRVIRMESEVETKER